MPTLSKSVGCCLRFTRKLSLLPLIASTTQACSLPESLSGQRKRMLGLYSCAVHHLCLISRLCLSLLSHSIRVYSPLHWQRPLSAQCQHCSLLLHCSARLCSLISHISCGEPSIFCQDILITAVTPDPTCSSQSRLSYFLLPPMLAPVLPLPYCHTGDNTYLSGNHIETVIISSARSSCSDDMLS